jgi:ElaB/YqjD/DUF883 family membrane-anchored ribosome-binding protein
MRRPERAAAPVFFHPTERTIMPTITTDTPNQTGYASDEELSVSAELESNRVLQKIRDKTDAVVERIQPKIAAVSDYARSEPTKAVLIAAAAGAGLMALLALLVRGSRPTPVSTGQRTMSAIRDAALDLADRAHSVATHAIGSAHKRASSAVDSAEQQAGEAKQRLEAMHKRAGEVADSVAETWASLREQAAPVVDKLKPQIDALATYAKEDPARAALGVATAGAVLIRPAQPRSAASSVHFLPIVRPLECGLTHFGRSSSRWAQSVDLLRRFPGRTARARCREAQPFTGALQVLRHPAGTVSGSRRDKSGWRPSVNKRIWATIVTSAIVVACGGGSSSSDGPSSTGGPGGSGDDGSGYAAGPGPLGGAALYSDFRSGKKLVLHQRGIIEVTPATLRDRLATMEPTLTAFDGAFLRLPTTGELITKATAVKASAIAADLQPLYALRPTRFKYNFAVVPVQHDLDVFDDWTIPLANIGALAKVARDAGLVGIVIDNESVAGLRVNYPGDVKFSNRSLEDYRAQTQLIGRKIMQAIVAEFPDAAVVVLRGPPAPIRPRPAPWSTARPTRRRSSARSSPASSPPRSRARWSSTAAPTTACAAPSSSTPPPPGARPAWRQPPPTAPSSPIRCVTSGRPRSTCRSGCASSTAPAATCCPTCRWCSPIPWCSRCAPPTPSSGRRST